jgi:protein-S-isoprenylcysteine O-methyltransferase Ste14
MSRKNWPLSARLFIAFVRFYAGGSLILFALFLALGPFGLVKLGLSPAGTLALDIALCLAFCVQHSVMVRRSFRRLAERYLPPHLGGVFYALVSAVMLYALALLWQESPTVVVRLEGAARWIARSIFVAALPGFVWSATAIPHFDPFGVGPIKDRLRGREPRTLPFAVRGPYRWVRHPQYFFTLVLIWANPDLTADRLVLNGILTAWIILGSVLEERDLVEEFGDDFVAYRRTVPMLIPWRRRRSSMSE